MNNAQRLAKLVEAERLLKKTKDGYLAPGEGIYWPPALKLIDEVQASLRATTPTLVFPIAAGDFQVTVGSVHETSGIRHNWAIDFVCKAGLGIVACEGGIITRFSGRDPSDDQADREGVYGWSTYWETAAGYEYYLTHQGRRYPTLRVGMRVQAGDLLGYVGDQRFRSDHAHLGVTSPKGDADGKARIVKVSKAPRVS